MMIHCKPTVEPDAGIGHRPAVDDVRVAVPAHHVAAVLLRPESTRQPLKRPEAAGGVGATARRRGGRYGGKYASDDTDVEPRAGRGNLMPLGHAHIAAHSEGRNPAEDLLTAPTTALDDSASLTGPWEARRMADVRAELMEGRAVLPGIGEVRGGDRASLPYLVVDAAGEEVEPISQFLRELTLSHRSALTVKSYAHDLLRWWRPPGPARRGVGPRDHGRGSGAGELATVRT
jgi:hypothetical protein